MRYCQNQKLHKNEYMRDVHGIDVKYARAERLQLMYTKELVPPIGDDFTAIIGTSVPVFGTKNLAMHCTAAYRASVCTAFA